MSLIRRRRRNRVQDTTLETRRSVNRLGFRLGFRQFEPPLVDRNFEPEVKIDTRPRDMVDSRREYHRYRLELMRLRRPDSIKPDVFNPDLPGLMDIERLRKMANRVDLPAEHPICVAREQRKEILFAKKKAGKGGQKPRRPNPYLGQINCDKRRK